jgi:hypothetical protein
VARAPVVPPPPPRRRRDAYPLVSPKLRTSHRAPTPTGAIDAEATSTIEEGYYQVGRQQAEDRFNRSSVRVQALLHSNRAQ